MYCRLQGYLSPHLVVYVRYQDPRPIARGLVPLSQLAHYIQTPKNLIFLTLQKHELVIFYSDRVWYIGKPIVKPCKPIKLKALGSYICQVDSLSRRRIQELLYNIMI